MNHYLNYTRGLNIVEGFNIFVTVGTTPFPSLVEHCKDIIVRNNWKAVIQAPGYDSNNNVQSIEFNSFVSDINELYNTADLVICHAGAGTCYKLAELGKRFIVVPNLERSDKHQLDLAGYFDKKNYAVVCYDLLELKIAINKAIANSWNPSKYNKEEFFSTDEIISKLV